LDIGNILKVSQEVRLADLLQFFESAFGRAEAAPVLLGVFLDLGAYISGVLTPDQALQELT